MKARWFVAGNWWNMNLSFHVIPTIMIGNKSICFRWGRLSISLFYFDPQTLKELDEEFNNETLDKENFR